MATRKTGSKTTASKNNRNAAVPLRTTLEKTAKQPVTKKTALMQSKVVEYVLGKGTSRLIDARLDCEEIRLLVNGPAMLYGSCRLLTSLDAADGATFDAWNKLAGALVCTSLCGFNGKTKIPIVVQTSRIGTCLEFGTGPMSMYLGTVVFRTKKKGTTLKQAIDVAFGSPAGRYLALIVPEPATGHLEHDASLFNPDMFPVNEPNPTESSQPAISQDEHHHHLPKGDKSE